MITDRQRNEVAKRMPAIPDIRKLVADDVPLIEAGPRSPRGLSVPSIIRRYGELGHHVRNALRLLPTGFRTIREARRSYRNALANIASDPSNATEELLSRITDLATECGCSAVGYARITPDLVFAEHAVLYPNAIVLLMDMRSDAISQAPSPASGREVWRTYHELGVAVNVVADYLSANGHGAQAGPALGGDVNYPLLAMRAGLGWIGRHGMLISPSNGPSQRIAVVYTSIQNLPIRTANAHEWIPEYCDSCNRCVSACPQAAIYPAAAATASGEEHIDFTKCAVAFSRTMGCSVCIRDCPFFQKGYEEVRKTHARRTERKGTRRE